MKILKYSNKILQFNNKEPYFLIKKYNISVKISLFHYGVDAMSSSELTLVSLAMSLLFLRM